MHRFVTLTRRVLTQRFLAAVALVALPPAALAQTSSAFTACSQGVLADCAVISLTSHIGVGPRGTNLFRIAIANLGSTATPSLATTIYNAIFTTGQAPAAPADQIDNAVVPLAVGGATVTDPTAWDVFDSGDAIFLSALSNNGVGGCVAGGPAAGFSQAGRTCGAGQFLAFSFFSPRAYDPTAITLTDLEFVGLTDQSPADSCNDATPCAISAAPVMPTPEPSTVGLMVTGFTALAGVCICRNRVQVPWH